MLKINDRLFSDSKVSGKRFLVILVKIFFASKTDFSEMYENDVFEKDIFIYLIASSDAKTSSKLSTSKHTNIAISNFIFNCKIKCIFDENYVSLF